MLCPGSLKWCVIGLCVAVGCGTPDTVGTAEESSSSGEPAGSTAEIATSTDPGPATTTEDVPGTTSAGTGSASGTTTEAPTGTESTGGSTGSASEGSTGGSTGDSGAMCRPGAEGDACSSCVAEQCNAGFCECMELGDCLCVLGCLDSDSLGALLGCVLGECGLVDVSLDNLTAVVTGALTPLDDCTALVGEEPAACAGVCPGLAVLP